MPPHTRPGPGLVTLLCLVFAYLLWRALAVSPEFLLSGLLTWTYLALFTMAVAAPPVWWALHRNVRPEPVTSPGPEGTTTARWALLVTASLVFLGNLLLLAAPNLAAFDHLDYNWQGKLVSLAAAVAFVALWPGLSRRRVGLTVPGWSGWWPVLVVTAVAALFWATLGASQPPMPLTVETLLSRAFVTSAEEELIWRGILWALLLQALPQTRRFGGQGWVLLTTSLLFGLVHGFFFSPGLSLTVDVPHFVFAAVAGLALGWIRIRSGSILPAMAAHSGINLSAAVLPHLVA